MELENLITELQGKLDDADLALDGGDVDEAREYLREAKALLDDEFLKD
jgi:Tfp pilus assembly protein FimV